MTFLHFIFPVASLLLGLSLFIILPSDGVVQVSLFELGKGLPDSWGIFLDKTSAVFLTGSGSIFTILAIYNRRNFGTKSGENGYLFPLSALTLICVFVSASLTEAILALSLYVLFKLSSAAKAAGDWNAVERLRFFVYSYAIAITSLFFVAVLLFGAVGYVEFEPVRASLLNPDSHPNIDLGLMPFAGLVIVVAVSALVFQVPFFATRLFFISSPGLFTEGVSEWIMRLTVAVYLLLRLSPVMFLSEDVLNILFMTGFVSALVGVLGALFKDDVSERFNAVALCLSGLVISAAGAGVFVTAAFYFFVTITAFLLLGILLVDRVRVERANIPSLFSMENCGALIAVCVLTGVLPFAGFFAGGESLWYAYLRHPIFGVLHLVNLMLLAFGVFRIYVQFYLKNQSTVDTGRSVDLDPLPVVLLIIACVTVGFLGMPDVLGAHFLDDWLFRASQIPASAQEWAYLGETYSLEERATVLGAMVFMILTAAVITSYWVRLKKPGSFEALAVLRTFVGRDYYVKRMYYRIFLRTFNDVSHFMRKTVDQGIITNIINSIGQVWSLFGGVASFKSSGNLNSYMFMILVGVFCLLSLLLGA